MWLGLAIIVLLGISLRVYFLVQYRPALLGYPDSANYLNDARTGLFQDPARVAGYVLFLRLLHFVYPHLEFVVTVQHALGIVSGLLLFDAVRRVRAPLWIGLVPAAVVMLGGLELIIEHSVLTDPLFIFLINLGIWCCVRTWMGSSWWALAAGLSLGAAMIDRTEGTFVFPVALICLCLRPSVDRVSAQTGEHRPGRLRSIAAQHPGLSLRLRNMVVCLVGGLLVVLPFLYAHQQQAGSFNFTTTGDIALYGRVAPWADCREFTPPPGTSDLCIHQPVFQRVGSNAWQYMSSSPAVRRFGNDLPVRGENAKLSAFAVAAIEAEPLTYLSYVGRDLLRTIDPRYSVSPNPAIRDRGYGMDTGDTLAQLFDLDRARTALALFANRYYRPSSLAAGNVSFLRSWAMDTWIDGPWFVIMLVLSLFGVLLARGAPRRMAILCLACAAALIIGPVLVLEWSARYEVPGLGPLSVAATIGLWVVGSRARAGLLARRVSTKHVDTA